MPSTRRSPHRTYYRRLIREYGPQGWWPARTRFEVVVGAILTQGVAWSNVERALVRLHRASLVDPHRMRRAPVGRIARLIRPAGYFNQKALKLVAFLDLLDREGGGRLARLLALPTERLRDLLLSVRGIGPETADAILIYAAGRPVMVVDAYTCRILTRHGLTDGVIGYEALRRSIEGGLPRDASTLGEYHALLVKLGKERCRKRRPLCEGCPLEGHLPPGGARSIPIAGRPNRRMSRTGARVKIARGSN